MKLSGKHTYLILALFYLFTIHSCSPASEQTPPLFDSLPSDHTKIEFNNELLSDQEFNVYKYRNFYNGAGVAVGDINGNGLPDIYLVANSGPNRLYINQGNFEFRDVTEAAGVAGTKPWSTGAGFVDINGNGHLDIYVTNSGEYDADERRNELFINNGDGTFTESANKYGLDDPGYSIHASFFDYNLDGYLDMYLLNNSDTSIVDFDLSDNQRDVRDPFGGDKLFRNENGYFTDVSEEAGIYGSEIGFSLSATIADLNRDGWPDIYVANDFFERDYLYLNNKDGTFREVLDQQMNSISAASMGADAADLTNNGWADIYVSDMLPGSDARTKRITTFENWELFSDKESFGYHYQLTRNTLQLNNGNGTYSEIGRLAEVQASDWSWAVLMADFDLNGYNDIFITNGLLQDITNLDFIEEFNNPDMVRSIISDSNVDFEQLIDLIPSTPIPNVMFANQGNLNFRDVAKEWGLGDPGFSSGAAWADFDQDGDLDLIVNDVNGVAKIYKNLSDHYHSERNSLNIKLKGQSPNTYGIGAKLEVWADSSYWYREHFLQRGFQSSVEPGLFVGVGEHSEIDSLKLYWPDGRITAKYNLKAPGIFTLNQAEAEEPPAPIKFDKPAIITGDIQPSEAFNPPLLTNITGQTELNWTHNKYDYNDFNREHLPVHMRSTEGPALCTGDVNGNGLEDIYVGGAREQSGILVLQDEAGLFSKSEPETFKSDSQSEDTDCAFFDANGNGLIDLYVTSGGNSFSTGSSALLDRLYLNDGTGNFIKSMDIIPPGGFSSNSTVTAADFTGNGHPDLFIGERLKLFSVGVPARGFLMVNDGTGNFQDLSSDWHTGFSRLGMVTDSKAVDWNGDGLMDLVVVGEWMPPRIFLNDGSSFTEITDDPGLTQSRGLWNTVHSADLDGDGRPDLILGNLGLNSHFRTDPDNPLKMWVADFQSDGMVEQILSRSIDQNDYPFVLRHDLLMELPSLQANYPTYKSFAEQSVQDIFTNQQLERSLTLQADLLESMVLYNKPDGTIMRKLPLRAQFSPVFGIWTGNITENGSTDLLTVGNLLEVKPMAGPYDASYGTVITTEGDHLLQTIPETISGLSVHGYSRNIVSVKNALGEEIIIISRNNDSPLFYRINKQ